MRTHVFLAAALISLTAVGVTGCGSETSTAANAATSTASVAAESSEEQSQAIVIDVRTPEEYAAGHLDGAVNINLQDPSFQAQIDGLDKTAAYVVYCRSGNRSAQAVDAMKNSGFENVTDLGSVESASESLGVSIVS